MHNQQRFLVFVMWGMIGVSCQALPLAAPAETPAPHTTEAHWSYSGDTGPEYWGELSEEFALCATGSAQTPIDIAPNAQADVANPMFAYQAGPSDVVNNGHTVQLKAEAANQMTIDGVTYTLLQMHFHAPSEHAIAGVRAPLEMHFVHQAADGTLAVVAVLAQVGAPTPAWDAMVNVLSTAVDETTTTTVDWPALLPTNQATYRYMGSLTTPPCSEGVHWMVMQTPITLSEAQIAGFTQAYAANARPLQAVNDREVLNDITP
jgi:carbonic anhydrase